MAAAIVHVIEHVSGIRALPPDAAALVGGWAGTYVIPIPGLHQPTLAGVLRGFSLSLSMLLATIGAAGLVVLKYGGEEPRLIRGVSRAFAIGTGALLVISIDGFFSLQTFFLAVTALAFALSAVSQEGD